MFAAKLFLITPLMNYLEKERKDHLEEQIRAKMKLAEEEHSKWLALAPRECHKYCRVMKMNGIPAFTMPFFPLIPLEEREGALNLIEARLTEVAERGYVYARSDLLWRHFGCRWSNEQMEITLLDLGSLVEERPENSKKYIKSQMEELKKRMREEPAAAPAAVLT